jgi:hypothetical protein
MRYTDGVVGQLRWDDADAAYRLLAERWFRPHGDHRPAGLVRRHGVEAPGGGKGADLRAYLTNKETRR